MKTLTLVLMFLMLAGININAQTTEFSYQGSLKDNATLANATYDFEFALFDAVAAGNQIGATLPKNNVPVANGIFSVKLDFGSVFPGASRFLEIRVRLAGQPGITTLAPRQLLDSAPYSVKSLTTDNAANAELLSGVPANQYVVTTDPRMTDPRTPLAGSGSYIQNQAAGVQASSDFSISGNGTAAGTLSGGIVNAGTQFNFNGQRILSAITANFTDNLFVGIGAGGANPTGINNVFIGKDAGLANTTGRTNTFVGAYTGTTNTVGEFNTFVGQGAGESATGSFNSLFGGSTGIFLTTGINNSIFGVAAGNQIQDGNDNSFFGRSAGGINTSGSLNSFFGRSAGSFNTTGTNNTAIGASAQVGNTLTFATALGSGATVSANNTVVIGRPVDAVQIPGSLNIAGSLTASGAGITNLNASNITGIVPIPNGGTGSATQNFVDLTNAQTIGGSKTFSSTTRVSNGASGTTPLASADLIVEDNTAAFQHFLTPNDIESGILFGDVTDSIAGGLIFNNAAANNGIQFRAGGNTTRMTLNGTGQLGIGIAPTATLHVGGASGDGSVILPNNAISSAEMFDEPGVAAAFEGVIGTAMSTSVQALLTRSIDVPTSGYVLVIGSAQGTANHTNGTATGANFGVSTLATAFPSHQDVLVALPASAATGTYNWPVAVQHIFTVNAGTQTFHLLGQESSGNWTASEMQLSLVFFATDYGIVSLAESVGNPQVTPDNGSSGQMIIPDTPREQNTDMLERIKSQQAEIDALKKLVCTSHPQAEICRQK